MHHVLKHEAKTLTQKSSDPFNKQHGNNNYEYRSTCLGHHRPHIGYGAFYDEFDKLCHKEDVEHLKVIAPGQHLYLGKLVADEQIQI